MGVMLDVAGFAQRFPVGRVEDRGQRFADDLRDLADVVPVLSLGSASLALPVSGGENFSSPCSPSWIGCQPATDNVCQPAQALPVWVRFAAQVLAHPFAVAGRGTEMVLGRVGNARRRTQDNLSAYITGWSGSQPVPARCTHPASNTAINLHATTGATNTSKDRVTLRALVRFCCNLSLLRWIEARLDCHSRHEGSPPFRATMLPQV